MNGHKRCSYLVKQLFSCRVGLDGELQLRVHGGDAHVDLQGGTTGDENWPRVDTRSNQINSTKIP